jgi:cell division protease FtsH
MHAQSLRTERNAIDIACKVTIVPRGQALGATQIVPLDDQHNYPRTYLLTRLAVGLGGRVAEELETGESTTGAENDLHEVTKLAREMVTRWGMSRRIGNVFLGGEQEVFLGREVGLRERQSYSEHTAALIDEEVQQVIGERSTYVHHLLSQRREELERVAQALLAQESLDEQQLHRLVTDMNVNAQLVSEGPAIGDSLAAPAPKG